MNAMRISALTTSILALLVCSSANASSFLCADTNLDARAWVEKYFGLADIVLLGTVTSVDLPDPDSYRRRMQERQQQIDDAANLQEAYELLKRQGERPTDYSEWPYASVTFDVVEQWKGPDSDVVAVKQDVSRSGGGFLVGNTYLVFGYEQDAGNFTVSTLCGGTIDADGAADRIEVLNDIAGDDLGEADER